mmetsp:Transcript_70129/g.195071  ORF Transcript_70129/g.195071 Transcript_70129/m.195071 type:complete len:280 (+) Transcript_70129:1156-1995(+)
MLRPSKTPSTRRKRAASPSEEASSSSAKATSMRQGHAYPAASRCSTAPRLSKVQGASGRSRSAGARKRSSWGQASRKALRCVANVAHQAPLSPSTPTTAGLLWCKRSSRGLCSTCAWRRCPTDFSRTSHGSGTHDGLPGQAGSALVDCSPKPLPRSGKRLTAMRMAAASSRSAQIARSRERALFRTRCGPPMGADRSVWTCTSEPPGTREVAKRSGKDFTKCTRRRSNKARRSSGSTSGKKCARSRPPRACTAASIKSASSLSLSSTVMAAAHNVAMTQ